MSFIHNFNNYAISEINVEFSRKNIDLQIAECVHIVVTVNIIRF